jgi:hypothetical protein
MSRERLVRKCATPELHQRLLQLLEYQSRQLQLEAFTARFTSVAGSLRIAETFRVPVAVHIVYSTDAENVSDEQVRSQIEVLNRDFQARNTDRDAAPQPWTGLVADVGVEFHLATVDPSGSSTNGITRTRTATPSFSAALEEVKSSATGGADPWPPDSYLNIWVCNLQGGILGYAQFPGGPAATDGVVILYSVLGEGGSAEAPFDLGRTATHEVGHWLNLRHIWGDVIGCGGSDYVDDTPPAERPNYGTPTYPHVTCSNGPAGDMFMNYMDYVDDKAMYMFTQGQVARMHATFAGPRSSFGITSTTRRSEVVNWVGTQSTVSVPQWFGWAVEFE